MHISKSGVKLFGRVSLLGEARGARQAQSHSARLRRTARSKRSRGVSFLLSFSSKGRIESVGSKVARDYGPERDGYFRVIRH